MAKFPLKVVVVGFKATGKSSIVSRLVSGNYSNDYEPTVFKNRYRKSSNVNNEAIDLEIIDTSGQNEYKSQQEETFISGDIFVIVYSINDLESFEYAITVRNHIFDIRHKNPFPLLLVGNKFDMNECVKIITDKGQQLAKQWNCGFLETSAKNNINIDQLFEAIVIQYKQFDLIHNISSIETQNNELDFKSNWIHTLCNICDKNENLLLIESHHSTQNANINKTHKPILVNILTNFKIQRRFIYKRFIISILCGICLPFVMIIQTMMFVICSDSSDCWIVKYFMKIIEWGIVNKGEIIKYDRMQHSLLLDLFGIIIGRKPNQDPEAQKNRKWFLKQTKSQKLLRIGLTILAIFMYAVCCFNLSQTNFNTTCLESLLESMVPFLLLLIFWIIFSFWIAYDTQLQPQLPSITKLQSVPLYFGETFTDTTSVYSFLRSYLSCRYSILKPSLFPLFIILCLSLLYALVPGMTRLHNYFVQDVKMRSTYSYFTQISMQQQFVRVGAFMVNTFLVSSFMYTMDLQFRRYLTNYKEWMWYLTSLLDKKLSKAYYLPLNSKSNALGWLEIRSYLLVEGRLFWLEQELSLALALLVSVLLTLYLIYITFFVDGDPMQCMSYNFAFVLLTILEAGLIRISITAHQLTTLQKNQQHLICQQIQTLMGNHQMKHNLDKKYKYLYVMKNFVDKNDIIPRVFNFKLNSVTFKVIAHVIISTWIITLKLLPVWYPVVIVSIFIFCLCAPFIVSKLKAYYSTLEFIWQGNESPKGIKDVTSPKRSFIVDEFDNLNELKMLSIPCCKGRKLVIYRKPNILFYNLYDHCNDNFFEKTFEVNEFDMENKYDQHEINLEVMTEKCNERIQQEDETKIEQENENSEEINIKEMNFDSYFNSRNIGRTTLTTPAISVTPFDQIISMPSINEERENIIKEGVDTPQKMEYKFSIITISDEKEYESSQQTVSTPNMSRTSTSKIKNGSVYQEIIRNENGYDSSQQTNTPITNTVSFDDDEEYDTDFDPNESELLKEIIQNENEWRQSIKQCGHGDDNNNNKNGNDNQQNNDEEKQNKNDDNNQKDQKDRPHKDNNGNDVNNGSGGGDEEKENKNNSDEKNEFDKNKMLKRMRELQKHRKYKIMAKKDRKLKSEELLALVYYTDSTSCCHQMKQVHRKKMEDNKFKALYFNATNGIIKMCQVFHYKNENQKHYRNKGRMSMLFHGSIIEQLDVLSQDQLFLRTMTSFSTNFGVAKSFATGMILVIDNAFDSLFDGTLKGADVSWINIFEECEYIILPTTFNNWTQMKHSEVVLRRWIVSSDVNIYVTNQYKSNKNPLTPFTDDICSEINISYDEYKINATVDIPVQNTCSETNDSYDTETNDNQIWVWFQKEVKLNEEFNKKYFDIMIENGFDTIDGIKEIEDNHLMMIGIKKLGHRVKIMNAIKRLNK